MRAVESKASELAAEGRPVVTVYLASQANDIIFHNISYIQQTFGGNYTFKMLSYVRVNGSNEIEYEIMKSPELKRDLSIEFFADIELFVRSTVFIGSASCMYIVAGLLRRARYFTRPTKNTCHVSSDEQLLCEDSEQGQRIYREYYGNKDSFVGGVPF